MLNNWVSGFITSITYLSESAVCLLSALSTLLVDTCAILYIRLQYYCYCLDLNKIGMPDLMIIGSYQKIWHWVSTLACSPVYDIDSVAAAVQIMKEKKQQNYLSL